MTFQSTVKTLQALGVEGDWASANPRWSAIAGPGAFVAGPAGVIIGRFAWAVPPVDQDEAPTVLNSFGVGVPMGFIHRDQQGLNTIFLAESGMTIPQGQIVTCMSNGEFLMLNRGSNQATVGMKAYARYADGGVEFHASGAPGTATGTAAIAASTSSVTGSIADNIMTVTAVGSGTVVAGTTISGSGVATGTQVVSQITPLASGEALGGIGRYYVSIPEQTVASTTISGTYGTMTVSAAGTGSFTVGDVLSGSGVVAGTTITQMGTYNGSTGTIFVNNNTVVGSTTITGALMIETKWYAVSSGAANELIKTSPVPQGFAGAGTF